MHHRMILSPLWIPCENRDSPGLLTDTPLKQHQEEAQTVVQACTPRAGMIAQSILYACLCVYVYILLYIHTYPCVHQYYIDVCSTSQPRSGLPSLIVPSTHLEGTSKIQATRLVSMFSAAFGDAAEAWSVSSLAHILRRAGSNSAGARGPKLPSCFIFFIIIIIIIIVLGTVKGTMQGLL